MCPICHRGEIKGTAITGISHFLNCRDFKREISTIGDQLSVVKAIPVRWSMYRFSSFDRSLDESMRSVTVPPFSPSLKVCTCERFEVFSRITSSAAVIVPLLRSTRCLSVPNSANCSSSSANGTSIWIVSMGRVLRGDKSIATRSISWRQSLFKVLRWARWARWYRMPLPVMSRSVSRVRFWVTLSRPQLCLSFHRNVNSRRFHRLEIASESSFVKFAARI